MLSNQNIGKIKLPYLLAASLHLILRFILITDPDLHQDPALLRGRLYPYHNKARFFGHIT